MLGDDFVFACGDGDKEHGDNEATNQVIDTDEEVDTNEALTKEEDEVKLVEMIMCTGKYKILKTATTLGKSTVLRLVPKQIQVHT